MSPMKYQYEAQAYVYLINIYTDVLCFILLWLNHHQFLTNMQNCFSYKWYIHNWIVYWIWLHPNWGNYFRNNNTRYLSFTSNTMHADALATLGARASTCIVSSPKHQKSYMYEPRRHALMRQHRIWCSAIWRITYLLWFPPYFFRM